MHFAMPDWFGFAGQGGHEGHVRAWEHFFAEATLLDGHQGDAEDSVLGKRGRPPYDVDRTLRRWLIRLFVTTDVSLSQIEKALAKAGGPRYVV